MKRLVLAYLFLATFLGGCRVTHCDIDCDDGRVCCKETCKDETCRARCDVDWDGCLASCR